jgi:hypothetical protein
VIEVYGPQEDRVDQGETQVDDDDRKHLFVSLEPNLPPGLYTVSWRNLSVEDGHEGSGEFSFTVKPAGGEAAPQANPPATQAPAAITPTQSSTPTSAPAPTPALPPSGGLPCLGGLLLGGMFLAVLTSGGPKRGIG